MREIQVPSITKTIRSLFPSAKVGISESTIVDRDGSYETSVVLGIDYHGIPIALDLVLSFFPRDQQGFVSTRWLAVGSQSQRVSGESDRFKMSGLGQSIAISSALKSDLVNSMIFDELSAVEGIVSDLRVRTEADRISKTVIPMVASLISFTGAEFTPLKVKSTRPSPDGLYAQYEFSSNARSQKQFFRDLQRAAVQLGYDEALDVLSVQLGQRTVLTMEIRESSI